MHRVLNNFWDQRNWVYNKTILNNVWKCIVVLSLI